MRVPARLVSMAGRAFLVVATGALLGGTFEDDLRCEEAAKHLEDCCTGVRASGFACEGGCGMAPSFSTEQARCLLALDCALLRQSGYCTWSSQTAEPRCP